MGEKKVCARCRKAKDIDKGYYKDKNKQPFDKCKDCMTAHLDVYNPDTYMHLLKEIDVPFVEEKWMGLIDKAYQRDPSKFSHQSIFGKYISSMKLKPWCNYTWADTEKFKEESDKKKAELAEERAKLKADYDNMLANGEITAEEYDSLILPLTDQKPPMMESRERVPASEQEAIGKDNAYNENNFIPEEDIDDGSGNLSEDDKLYLALKWGRLYKPGEWIQLEKFYNQTKESFEIADSDTEATVILLSKTNLKMNQAIDNGDIDGFNKLSKTYNDLRKTSKFTAAQNKDGKQVEFDSVGQIVAFCESTEGGGAIEKFKIDTPLDIIDKVIADMKEYNKTLVYEDKSLAKQIEEYLIARKQLDENKMIKQIESKYGVKLSQLRNQDMEDFLDQQAEEMEHDAKLQQGEEE